MVTYLYCVRDGTAARPTGVFGLDGAPVRAIDAVALVAWASDFAEPTVDVTVDRLKAHDAVCAAALDSGETPLPIRFGQTFADDAALVAGIVARESELRDRLVRISGCVELRIVVTQGRDTDLSHEPHDGDEADSTEPVDDAPSPLEGPGTAFLRRLARAGRADLAREVACEDTRHAVRALSPSLIVDQLRCETARGMAFFPVLVRRGDVEAFRGSIAEILPSQQIALSVLGPFAPYSFASDA